MITISAFADEISPDLDQQMATCEELGIYCIDVRQIDGKNVSKMTVEEARAYRRRMDDRGFICPCLGTPIGKQRLDQDFEEHLDLLKHCFDLAHAFGTRRLRVFSFYPPEGGDFSGRREEVMDRMRRMCKAAAEADMLLLHENEKRIFGARPAGVLDLYGALDPAVFKLVFDPANYVEEEIRPFAEAWQQGLAEKTYYLHVKDKVPGQPGCVPAGHGEGDFDVLFSDLEQRRWSGFMTLEPHMKAAGQFSGFSGPDLFSKAALALQELCRRHGLAYR